MDYVELNIPTTDAEQSEILVAELAEYPFESFTTEGSTRLKGYIPQEALAECKEAVDEILAQYGVTGSRYISIETQNWNAEWESNFPRVEVGDKLLIRAPFHGEDRAFAREVIIMPKMSFGTGHHATTHLMSEWVVDLGMEGVVSGAEVLDMGSGTGVLAIIAAKEGARRVDAVDIDEWADENCRENIKVNGVEQVVRPLLGDFSVVAGERYDIILANINRNILVANMERFATALTKGGSLLMSGFLEEDIPIIESAAEAVALKSSGSRVRDGWAAVRVVRD